MAEVVFVSWSKYPSDELALAIKDWLGMVVPPAEVFFSKAIAKGREGDVEIKKGLAQACFGISCVTQQNVAEKWLLFEAGALYNKFEVTRVAPILFDVKLGDVGAPLTKLQCTAFEQKEMLDLAMALNSCFTSPLPESFIQKQCGNEWPELEKRVRAILEEAQAKHASVATEDAPPVTLGDIHEALLRQSEMVQEVYRRVTQQPSISGVVTTKFDDLMRTHGFAPTGALTQSLLSGYTPSTVPTLQERIAKFSNDVVIAEMMVSDLEAKKLPDSSEPFRDGAAVWLDGLNIEAKQIVEMLRSVRKDAPAFAKYAAAHGKFSELKERFSNLLAG